MKMLCWKLSCCADLWLHHHLSLIFRSKGHQYERAWLWCHHVLSPKHAGSLREKSSSCIIQPPSVFVIRRWVSYLPSSSFVACLVECVCVCTRACVCVCLILIMYIYSAFTDALSPHATFINLKTSRYTTQTILLFLLTCQHGKQTNRS